MLPNPLSPISVGETEYYPTLRMDGIGVFYRIGTIGDNYKTLNDIVKEKLEAISSSTLRTDPYQAKDKIDQLKISVSRLQTRGRELQYGQLQGFWKGVRSIEIAIRSILGRFCVPGCFYYNRDTEIAKVEAEVNKAMQTPEASKQYVLGKMQKTTPEEHKKMHDALSKKPSRTDNSTRMGGYQIVAIDSLVTVSPQLNIKHTVVITYGIQSLYIGLDESDRMRCFWSDQRGYVEATPEGEEKDKLVSFAQIYNDYLSHSADACLTAPPSVTAEEGDGDQSDSE